ncbi:MAG: PRC-barrel domain-containing protein [Pseudomonadota bacterium]
MKKLIAAASVAALFAAAPAIAQNSTNTDTMQKPADAMQKPADTMSKPTDATTPKSMKPTDQQAAAGEAIRASDLLNLPVYSGENAIGDINDILLNESGEADRVIIGIGGFLGLGEKNIAVSFSDLTITRNADNELRVTTNMTKKQLNAAPRFTPADTDRSVKAGEKQKSN